MRIFIGYDTSETVAYHVLAQSIIENATTPISITPLARSHLVHIHTRERSSLESTDFSITRFLVPALCDYQGWALFMDCDMLMRHDVADLWAIRDDQFAVMCVKHDYVPSSSTKFLGNVQTTYEKKNWSSVVMFNTPRCRALTPDAVQRESGLFLHQFKWLRDESEIGALPSRWNYLVGESPHDPDPALAHFTLGGPYFPEYAETEFADEWRAVRARVLGAGPRQA